jgi:hypothetical protein
MFLPRKDERMIAMKEKYLAELSRLADTLTEEQLLYILTIIEKLFGSH